MIAGTPGAGRFTPPGPGIDQLSDIDRRMAEAVAEADWLRFQSLLDELLSLPDDLGEPAPAAALAEWARILPERSPELLQSVKRGLVELVTARRQMQQRAGRVREDMARLDGQARQSAAIGRDDLARLARQQQQNARLELEGLDAQIAGIERQQARLTQAVRRADAGPGNDDTVEAELAALKAAAATPPERRV